MSVTVTLHVFSGRQDPAWELTLEQIKELTNRLTAIEQNTLMKPPGVGGGLGYRGFSIDAVREKDLEPEIYVHGGIVDQARFDLNLFVGRSLEPWLLSTAGGVIDDGVRSHVNQKLNQLRQESSGEGSAIRSVPPFNPGKWNNDPNIRMRNNCYNYANDKITNTFAQPGRGSGKQFSVLTCKGVGIAAERDGQKPQSNPASTPSSGHFIALVVWPQRDYHWYRLDSDGYWSHKPGKTVARNTDNSSQLIVDPKSCDRGPYTRWCNYYNCVPANTRIF